MNTQILVVLSSTLFACGGAATSSLEAPAPVDDAGSVMRPVEAVGLAAAPPSQDVQLDASSVANDAAPMGITIKQLAQSQGDGQNRAFDGAPDTVTDASIFDSAALTFDASNDVQIDVLLPTVPDAAQADVDIVPTIDAGVRTPASGVQLIDADFVVDAQQDVVSVGTTCSFTMMPWSTMTAPVQLTYDVVGNVATLTEVEHWPAGIGTTTGSGIPGNTFQVCESDNCSFWYSVTCVGGNVNVYQNAGNSVQTMCSCT